MSRASSPSTGCRYGTARSCRLWNIPRSTLYERRARAQRPPWPESRLGPKNAWTDAALREQIRSVLACSPFVGEGYRKLWARLRLGGVRSSESRVLRLEVVPEFVEVEVAILPPERAAWQARARHMKK